MPVSIGLFTGYKMPSTCIISGYINSSHIIVILTILIGFVSRTYNGSTKALFTANFYYLTYGVDEI